MASLECTQQMASDFRQATPNTNGTGTAEAEYKSKKFLSRRARKGVNDNATGVRTPKEGEEIMPVLENTRTDK